MKNLSILFFLIIIFNSCHENTTSQENIQIRDFCLTSNLNRVMLSKITIIENHNKKIFIYESDNYKDTLLIQDNTFYYRGQLLKEIDKKDLSFDNKNFILYKFLFEQKRGLTDLHLYIEKENGILFQENLFTGTMTEYDIKKFHDLHKKIALKEFHFKDGPFEAVLPYRNYPEIEE